jgi:transposase
MPLAPAPKLEVSERDRKELVGLSRQRSIPRGILLRVNIVLGAAAGRANHLLARELSTTITTVLLWRKRYETDGLVGLFADRPRSGRPKQISEDREAAIVEATIKTVPKDATHWSVRAMASSQKVSPATVLRIWKKHKLQPHRVESFKFSNDPDFAPKVRDIVGLYMNPPDKAIVLSVDEKSQIQALDRTQPILPLRPGLPERQTHDYKRHGTTTLFAALNVLEGTVIGECQPRHRHQEFLRFLDRIDQSVETGLDIHLVLDNYGTHKHPQVQKWLAERPRYHVHFTPTGSSWLNQVERWFAEITRKRIRRGTFRSVRELTKAIHDYIRTYNNHPRPFQWIASASRIIRKVNKYRRTLETGD